MRGNVFAFTVKLIAVLRLDYATGVFNDFFKFALSFQKLNSK